MVAATSSRVDDRPALICFDLGGVICRFDQTRRLSVLAEASGLEPSEIKVKLWTSGFVDRVDRGEYTRETEFKYVRDTLGLTCDYPTYRRLWCSAFTVEPDMLSIADAVRAHAHTAILTNNGPILADAFQHELVEITRHFDHMFCSYQFGAAKPGEAVYRAVQAVVGKHPNELALIDDSAANVEAARSAGWRGILFKSAVQLQRDLQVGGGAR